MESTLLVIIVFLIVIVSYYIRVTIYKLIVKLDSQKIHPEEKLHAAVVIAAGFISLLTAEAFEEPLLSIENKYFVIIPQSVAILGYFLSKSKKQGLHPIVVAILPSVLALGIITGLLQVIHYFTLTLLFASILVYPLLAYLSLIIMCFLMSNELIQLIKMSHQHYGRISIKSFSLNKLSQYFFGNNLRVFQILSIPLLFLSLTWVLSLFNLETQNYFDAFLEKNNGLFAQTPPYRTTVSDYFCTIAANGSPWLIGKTFFGRRHGDKIIVSRQLQICNAFEELLSERKPKTHRLIRKVYDGMQINVNKWKNVKLIANILFILLKPIEWFSLISLKLFDSDSEKRIKRQYLTKTAHNYT